MPTYSYRCTECDTAFDIHQAFTEDSLTVCPTCSGVLRKVFSPIGVSFNGSGFYRNDSRAGESKKSGSTSASSSDKSGSESKSSEKSSTEKSAPSTSEKAPAAAPAAAASSSSPSSTGSTSSS